VPRGNREAVKLHGDIFEKFNENNQLSRRGAWVPRPNNNSRHFEELMDISHNIKDADEAPEGQPSRNKPFEGLYNHKKNQSLKLVAQKPKNKFNPNVIYQYERESMVAETGSPG